ncbi:MAG: hypothetical protein AB7D08_08680 [Bacteroidales bacterium]|jgi:hypothetical protein
MDILDLLEAEGKAMREQKRLKLKQEKKAKKYSDPVKRGKRAKAKGREGENEVVMLLARYGIEAERMPLSGSLGGKYKNDIRIAIGDKRVEVKRRKSGLKTVYSWLNQDDCDYLFFRPDGDRDKWIVIMPLVKFVDLLINGGGTIEP